MIRSATLRDYVARNRVRLGGLALLSLLVAAVALLQPLLLQQLFDTLTSGAVPTGMVVMLTCLVVVQAAATGVETYALASTAHGFVLDLRKRIARKVVHLPMTRLQETPHGDLLSRLISDTSAASTILTTGVFKLIAAVVTFIFAATLMATIDSTLFFIAVSITVVAALLSTVMGRLVRRASARTQAAIATFTGAFDRILLAIPLIRAYGVTEKQLALIARDAGAVRNRSVEVARLGAYIQPVMTLATQALLLVTLAVGGFRVSEGTLTLGGLIAFMMYLLMMVGPVSQVGGTFVSIQSGLAAMERIDAVMGSREEQQGESLDAEPRIDTNSCLLSFDDVIFRYSDRTGTTQTQIGPLTFAVDEAQHVAIVGPSGSGKSTIFALLERFYEPSRGTIRFKGQTNTEHQIDAYRAGFAWIPQNSPPLGGTLRDNLDIEQRGLPDAKMREALTAVGLFIEQGPAALDRDISNQGAGLSGGERQRLGLARALLSGRDILLLDEPTSSLDALSAQALSTLIRTHAQAQTVIMSSHRLADVINFDSIIVLDKGEVVDIGRHDELIGRCVLYRELAMQQGLFTEATTPASSFSNRDDADRSVTTEPWDPTRVVLKETERLPR